MRGTELLDKMELVNAAFVQAADQPPAGKRRGRIRWLAVAACFCLVAVAALALWRGSTPAQHAPALEKLRIPDLVPGGMGFEGYLYYRAAELENGNPWHEGMALRPCPYTAMRHTTPPASASPRGWTRRRCAHCWMPPCPHSAPRCALSRRSRPRARTP